MNLDGSVPQVGSPTVGLSNPPPGSHEARGARGFPGAKAETRDPGQMGPLPLGKEESGLGTTRSGRLV